MQSPPHHTPEVASLLANVDWEILSKANGCASTYLADLLVESFAAGKQSQCRTIDVSRRAPVLQPCRVAGVTLVYQSSSSVSVVEPSGRHRSLDLTTLPQWSQLSRFQDSMIILLRGRELAALSSEQVSLKHAVEQLEQVCELLYWQKICVVAGQHLQRQQRVDEAKLALARAGFSVDEVEGIVSHLGQVAA